MTENEKKTEKPLEVSLKQEDRDLLKSVIEASKTVNKPAAKEEKTEHDHFHTDLAFLEDPNNCPECKKGLEQFGKEYMQKTLLERKDLELECENCGTPVKEEEESCPTCGSKNASPR